MNKRLQKLFNETGIGLEDNHEELTEEGEAELEESLDEVDEAAEDVEESEEVVEELEDVADGLEAIATVLEPTIEDGGIDKRSAAVVSVAVETLTDRIGLSTSPMPSLESWGSESERQEATQISVEGIKETAKKVWNAIKEAVMRAIQAIADFFSKLFQSTESMKKHINQLKEEVAGLGKEPGKEKMTLRRANQLHYAGKTDVSSIIKGMEETQSTVKNAVEGVTDSVIEVYTSLGKSYVEMVKAKNEEDVKKADREPVEAQVNLIKQVNTVERNEMSGGKKTSMTVEEGDDADDKEVWKSKFKFRIVDADKSDKVESTAEIDTPKKDDLKKLLEISEGIVEHAEKKKKSLEKMKEVRKKAVEAGDKLVKEADKGKLEGIFDSARLNAVLRRTNAAYDSAVTQIISHGMQTSRAATGLVADAVKAYKAKSDD